MADAFDDGLPAGGPGLSDDARQRLAEARARWPHGPAPDAAFAAFVAARTPVRLDELYLAWWCSTGDPAAIAAFDAAFDGDLRAALSRFRDLPVDELRQQLRIKLFVGAAPKILEYSGKGALGAWLRVTAIRSFVDVTRSTRMQRYEQELDENELLGLSDPARARMSSQLGAAVKKAFAEAVAGLSTRQRVFLRHAYVDRHTLDEIATHYAMHRATVARTLGAAREQLIERTRAAVARDLGIPADELATMVRALDSRLELSLSRVLEPVAGNVRI